MYSSIMCRTKTIVSRLRKFLSQEFRFLQWVENVKETPSDVYVNYTNE